MACGVGSRCDTLCERRAEQRAGGAPGERAAMIVRSHAARHGAEVDRPQEHMLPPAVRAARAVRTLPVLGLHDRAELREEIVGQFVQRILDLARRQFREGPRQGCPHRIIDPCARCLVRSRVVRAQRYIDLSAQRSDAFGARLEVERTMRLVELHRILVGNMGAHFVAGAQRPEWHGQRQRILAARKAAKRLAVVETRAQQREVLQRLPDVGRCKRNP
jgi:hypothetical protein